MKAKFWTITAVFSAAMLSSASFAQDRLAIGSASSRTMGLLSESLLPKFEQEQGVKVEVIAGTSVNHFSRLQAQQGNQELDVVMLDSPVMKQAVKRGFCEALPAEFTQTFEPMAVIDGHAVGIGFGYHGIVYNTEIFAKEGWEAPVSWNDLARPEFSGHLSLATIGNGYGLATLILLARANGGGEKNIEPGLEAMKKVALNVVSFLESTTQIPEMLQAQEIAITTWSNVGAKQLVDAGLPIEFVVPEEGTTVDFNGLCVVKGGKNAKAALELVKLMTSEAAQRIYAKVGYGPTLRALKLEAGTDILVSAEDSQKALPVDSDVIAEFRPEWTRSWNREIER